MFIIEVIRDDITPVNMLWPHTHTHVRTHTPVCSGSSMNTRIRVCMCVQPLCS